MGRGRGRRRGRAAAPPERPVEDMRKDDVSGNKTPPVAPATSPVKESEEKMETEVKEEGEGRVEEGREGEMKEEEMKMDVYEGALAANTNNNSNKRSGGEEGGSGEEEEEGNRRRSLRTRNRQSQKVCPLVRFHMPLHTTTIVKVHMVVLSVLFPTLYIYFPNYTYYYGWFVLHCVGHGFVVHL